jgi:hypothetical protein
MMMMMCTNEKHIKKHVCLTGSSDKRINSLIQMKKVLYFVKRKENICLFFLNVSW